MDAKGLELFEKIEEAVKAGSDGEVSLKFLAALSADDYDYLINFFSDNDFATISGATKEKLLIILRALREQIS